MRKCVKCGYVKPLSEFSFEPRIEGGRKVKCKRCERRDMERWVQHARAVRL